MNQPAADPTGNLAYSGSSPESEIDLHQYLRVLRRRWKLIVAGCLVAAAVGLVQYFTTPKEYRATAMVQIERRSLSPLIAGQNPWLENYWNMEFYPTQYRLLRSRGLAERVIQDQRLAEDPRFNPGGVRLAPRGDGPVTAQYDEAALGRLASRLLSGLEVNPLRDTQLVEISYRSTHPELTALVANGVAQAFIDWGIETRSTTVGKASSFLASQIETLKQEVQSKELQLQSHSGEADIVTADPSSNVLLQRLEALNRDYIQAVSNRIDKEARYHELVTAPEDTSADTLSSGLVSQLRGELLQLESDYATRLHVYKPEWPAMVELKSRIDKKRQHLGSVVAEMVSKAREAARSEYQTALRREQAIADEIKSMKARATQLNSAAIESDNLKLEIATRRGLLDELLRKQSETEVTSRLQATRETNIRMIDRALVPGGPFKPSLRQDLSRSLLAGLAVALVVIVLLEFMDRTLKTAEQVERQLRLPVLAVVPELFEGRGYGYGASYGYGAASKKSRGKGARVRRLLAKGGAAEEPLAVELVPHSQPRLAISEVYRSLRTALLLSSAEELRAVAVTSAQAGEGKTVTAVNLAAVMAQLDRRVLIVDGDLRRPRLHKVFRQSNQVGLVNHLTGQIPIEQAFRRTDIPNLYVTPSGPTPPNPSELLASQRMAQFIEQVRGTFDFVVFDTSPTLAVTDAILLGARTDGVIVCFQAGRVLRQDARACVERLRMADLRILGAVLNRSQPDHSKYARSYQYQEYAPVEEHSSHSAA